MSEPPIQWLRPEVLLDALLTEHDHVVASAREDNGDVPPQVGAAVPADAGLDERS
jgi:hypothetical protein